VCVYVCVYIYIYICIGAFIIATFRLTKKAFLPRVPSTRKNAKKSSCSRRCVLASSGAVMRENFWHPA
jgi:hypothetical protein